jgi:hypothetical protein
MNTTKQRIAPVGSYHYPSRLAARRGNVVVALLPSFFVISGCGGADSETGVPTPEVSERPEELYLITDPYPNGVLTVCFAGLDGGPDTWSGTSCNPPNQGICAPNTWDVNTQILPTDPDFPQWSNNVRRVVYDGWGMAADLHFQGWQVCPASYTGLVPVKLFRHGSAKATNGLIRLGVLRSDWAGTMLHEMGHVLGFIHDTARADFNEASYNCTPETDIPGGNTLGTPVDPQSIMVASGYCQSNNNLSQSDKVGSRSKWGGRLAGIVLTGNSAWTTTVQIAFGQPGTIGNFFALGATVSSYTGFPSAASQSGVTKLTGDFDGDGWSDLALTGGANWNTVPTARTVPVMGALGFGGFGNGHFTGINSGTSGYTLFPVAAAQAPASGRLVGDFNGDSMDDIVLVGGTGWNTVAVALSNGDGTFTANNNAVAGYTNFPTDAAKSGQKRLIGDYNGDGNDDIALIGASPGVSTPGIGQIAVALSDGDGTFTAQYSAVSGYWLFPNVAAQSGAFPYVGDFNGDGNDDIVLLGGTGWNTIPLALSDGDGTFTTYNNAPTGYTSFPAAATQVSSSGRLIGDFLGDGRDAIVMTGGAGWNTLPFAYYASNGTFTAANFAVHGYASFPAAGAQAMHRLVGDFNGDGQDDIALTGNNSWNTLPVATHLGFGVWTATNNAVGGSTAFSSHAAISGVSALPNYFGG